MPVSWRAVQLVWGWWVEREGHGEISFPTQEIPRPEQIIGTDFVSRPAVFKAVSKERADTQALACTDFVLHMLTDAYTFLR